MIQNHYKWCQRWYNQLEEKEPHPEENCVSTVSRILWRVVEREFQCSSIIPVFQFQCSSVLVFQCSSIPVFQSKFQSSAVAVQCSCSPVQLQSSPVAVQLHPVAVQLHPVAAQLQLQLRFCSGPTPFLLRGERERDWFRTGTLILHQFTRRTRKGLQRVLNVSHLLY